MQVGASIVSSSTAQKYASAHFFLRVVRIDRRRLEGGDGVAVQHDHRLRAEHFHLPAADAAYAHAHAHAHAGAVSSAVDALSVRAMGYGLWAMRVCDKNILMTSAWNRNIGIDC